MHFENSQIILLMITICFTVLFVSSCFGIAVLQSQSLLFVSNRHWQGKPHVADTQSEWSSFYFISFFLFFSFFFFFCFLGSYLRHMEVPRLGVQLELHLPAHATATATSDPNRICDLYHSSRQGQILNPLSEARDQTCNLMVPNQIHFCCTTMGTPKQVLNY